MKLKLLFAAGALIAGFFSTAVPLQAQGYFTHGHGDIGIGYTPGETEFDVHWHVGAGAMVDGLPVPVGGQEYAPEDLIAHPSTTLILNASTIADAMGVATGSTVYRMGNNNYQPNLGFAAEEIGYDDSWGNDGYIKVSLTGFSGPGEMVISETASSGVIFASLGDAFTGDNNQWEIYAGDHVHLHWFFSEAGFYEITFTWEGTYTGGGPSIPVTGTGTFGVQVDAIPEPGTWALMCGGLAGLAFYSRRRMR